MDQGNSHDNPLFPSTASFFVFWSYISLFVSQGLLVTAVQKSNIPGFNAVIVVLLAEVVKLCICLAIYILRPQSGGIAALLYDIKVNKKLLLLYLVPAFLYCIYNNLTFVNLSLFDVSTYFCLMQFRVVLTAVIYQVLFRRQLTLIQRTSLLILTTGCLIKEYGVYDHQAPTRNSDDSLNQKSSSDTKSEIHHVSRLDPIFKFFWSTGLLLFQMFCSCFAGVYNEYLLKDSSSAKNADVILQNIFMYFDSIICNLIAFKFSSSYPGNDVLFSDNNYLTILRNLLTSPLVIILILNNALSGLVASFFLKTLNSILKTFAAALELFAVTFLAWILFDNKVDTHTLLALIIVSFAMIVYSRNPVSVAPPARTIRVENNHGFVLLPMNEQ